MNSNIVFGKFNALHYCIDIYMQHTSHQTGYYTSQENTQMYISSVNGKQITEIESFKQPLINTLHIL